MELVILIKSIMTTGMRRDELGISMSGTRFAGSTSIVGTCSTGGGNRGTSVIIVEEMAA